MKPNSDKFILLLRKLREFSARKNNSRILSKLTKSLIKRLVRHGLLRNNGFTYSIYGIWLRDNWDDATFRFCATGSYGFFYSDWLESIDNCVFIDIGANLGLYSLVASKNPEIKKIYSFEPQPNIFKFLTTNIERNLSTKVIPLPYAISDTTEECEIQIKEGHSGAATLRENAIPNKIFAKKIKISKVNHEFLNSSVELEPEVKKIAVKIDTEGHEEKVIAELIKTKFWDKVFNIFYEVDERYINQEKILGMLYSEGFSVIYKNGEEPHYDLMLERESPKLN